MSDTFLHQNAYFVMVCELLGDSLYDFLSLGLNSSMKIL